MKEERTERGTGREKARRRGMAVWKWTQVRNVGRRRRSPFSTEIQRHGARRDCERVHVVQQGVEHFLSM